MVEIIRFTLADAADDDLAGWHRVLAAQCAEDRPTEPPMSYAAAVGRLSHPPVGFGEVRHWIARDGGQVAAVATVALMDEENSAIALPDVDPARWEIPVPDGYQLRRWVGPTPSDVIESYARARTAIEDMPSNESAYQHPGWSPDRVRAREAEYQESGVEHRVVVALRGDEVAGLTEVLLYPHLPTRALQGDTAVLAEHRGRRLGACVKAEMLLWLRAERPGIERVSTSTDDHNVHMSRINLSLGFETVRTLLSVEAKSADLR